MLGSLPGAILEPGLLWAGLAGYSTCDLDCWHYTVGWNSIGICRDRGLVQHLTRDEGVYQFVADVGMVAHTQCEWNRVATANEVESIDGSVSDAQLALMAYREQWLISVSGIPPTYFDAPSMGAPRMPVGTPFRGVTTHRSLVHNACDMHSDGFDVDVWDRVWHGTPEPEPERPKEPTMRLFHDVDADTWAFWTGVNWQENVPRAQVDALIYAGVPHGDIRGPALNDVRRVVGEHVEALVQRIAAAVGA